MIVPANEFTERLLQPDKSSDSNSGRSNPRIKRSSTLGLGV
jgi:hypothetical protein